MYNGKECVSYTYNSFLLYHQKIVYSAIATENVVVLGWAFDLTLPHFSVKIK